LPLGYNIFRNKEDDQREAMVSQNTYANEGITWHIRMLRLRYLTYTLLWVIGAMCFTALADYALFKFTDHSGLFGWLFSSLFG